MYRSSSYQIQVLVAFMLLVTGCTKNYDDYGPKGDSGKVVIPEATSVIVVNEGNFMFGNGSISWMDLEQNTTSQEVFKSVNGFPLGDVPQSMVIEDSLGYVVVNNSGKIEIVTMPDFTSVATINGFNSPRQMAVVSEQPKIAWVTDLYADKIWEVNLDTRQITGSIPSIGWDERIMVWKDLALVLNKKDSVINVFDIASKSKVKTYQFTSGIVDFEFSKYAELMVVAKEGIYRIDLLLDGVYQEFEFVKERNPLKMAQDTINQITYFLDGDVCMFQNGAVDEVVRVPSGANFYGLAVNAGNVYVTNSKDYVQPGELVKYDMQFQDSTIYPTGVNPQFILFP